MSAKYEYRKEKIANLLAQKGKVSNSEIAELFDLSPASVRRFCANLESDGTAIRMRGGIRTRMDSQLNYSFDSESHSYMDEKIRIAEFACQSIRDDQVVFLESGTTIYQCAIALANLIRNQKCKNITIFTNSLNNLEVLAPVAQVMLVGGEYRPARQDFVGYLCEKFLRNLRFDLAFIGVDAIDPEDGLMVLDYDTARIDETLLQQSDSVTVVAHSEKFKKRSILPFAQLNDISRIVTDHNLPDNIFNSYHKFATELIRV